MLEYTLPLLPPKEKLGKGMRELGLRVSCVNAKSGSY